ncbi:hypothetical protein Q3G72_022743 [Acer saccharum]|nr:hypothetical protein Q3G72_022743 [Acer saccharum]
MWPDLIQKAKDGGLDVIQTYVFWNGHEPSPGKYYFEDRYDLVRFIKLVQQAGLLFHLRIGPYVCAEWNYGGFPVWLKYVPGIEFRTDNEPFKAAMQKFTEKIVSMMKAEKLFQSQGDLSLAFLANGYCSKTLKKLFISECDRVTDVGVSRLRHMSCLEELSLADCGPLVTDISGVAIAFIKTLKRLDFSWLINLSDITITAVNQNCKDLVELNLTGCTSITGFDLHVFANHEHLESIILVSCYYINSFSLDMMLQCQSLNYIVVDKRVRLQMSEAAKDRIDALGRVHWR